MAVTENTRAEQGQQGHFDIPCFKSDMWAAIYGIQAITYILRGDSANRGSVAMDGTGLPILGQYVIGGLVEALGLLAAVAEVEVEKLEERQ